MTFVVESEEEESEDEQVEESFFSLLIDKLLTLHKAKDKAVRSVLLCAWPPKCVTPPPPSSLPPMLGVL